MRRPVAWLAILGSAAMSFFAIRAIAITVPQFSDPCFEWGSSPEATSGGVYHRSISATDRPGDPCVSGYGATSETKARALTRLLVVPCGILVAAVLGILGIGRRKPVITLIGAFLMLLEAAPLIFSLAPVAVLTGGALLVAALRQGSTSGPAAANA